MLQTVHVGVRKVEGASHEFNHFFDEFLLTPMAFPLGQRKTHEPFVEKVTKITQKAFPNCIQFEFMLSSPLANFLLLGFGFLLFRSLTGL